MGCERNVLGGELRINQSARLAEDSTMCPTSSSTESSSDLGHAHKTSAPRPASASGRAARREKIRKRLLIAIEEALEAGSTYNDLTVGWPVAEAKISRATSYTYFEDQGYLLSALSEHVVSDMVDAGRHWWSIPPEATKADLRKAVQPPCDSYRRYRAP